MFDGSSDDQEYAEIEAPNLKDKRNGFVGWTGHLQLPSIFKGYLTYFNKQELVSSYHDYAQGNVLELITSTPGKNFKDIKAVFFERDSNFSRYFHYDDFGIKVEQLSVSLVDFLNFVTHREGVPTKRLDAQDFFVNGFVSAYKGLESGLEFSIGDRTGLAMLEHLDKYYVIHLGLAYCAANSMIYEEVKISGKGQVPRGNIDFICFSNLKAPPSVAVKFISDTVSLESKCFPTATSLKTNEKYSSIGSTRQVIVELLAFSEVLKNCGSDSVCCVIKATWNVFQPYFYLPKSDVLVRTKLDIPINETDCSNKAIGNFILALIFNHRINYKIIEKLSEPSCGWADAFKNSQGKYNDYFQPQLLKMKKASSHSSSETQAIKKTKLEDYSEFC